MAILSEKDACDFLDADHRTVKKLFKFYDELAGSQSRTAVSKRMDIARQICQELTVHTQIEEEIFYPQIGAKIKEADLLAQAMIEHATAKALILQIEEAQEVDVAFDAKVKVLGEYVEHHIKEERTQVFSKARAAHGLDLVAMRRELEARKEELIAETHTSA